MPCRRAAPRGLAEGAELDHRENALFNHGQLEPGMSVLTKPFAVDTLAARIRELIAK